MKIVFFVFLGLVVLTILLLIANSLRGRGIGGGTQRVWQGLMAYASTRWLVLIFGWMMMLLCVYGLLPGIWDRYWGNQWLFWISQIGVLTIGLLWNKAGGRAGKWLGCTIAVIILFTFGREILTLLPAPAAKTGFVEWQLCSAEDHVRFTRSLSGVNREDPDVLNLPGISLARCINLRPEQIELGKPFVFSYRVHKKGFDADGAITLHVLSTEADGWERVEYIEHFTNPLDGKVIHKVEGLLWGKSSQYEGLAKDSEGKSIAFRLLLRRVMSSS